MLRSSQLTVHCLLLLLSHRIVIGISEDARIVQGPETLRMLHGSTALLFCRAEGSPAPEIQWLLNGRPVPLNNQQGGTRYYAFSIAFGQVLKIDALDAGQHNGAVVTCVARNAVALAPAMANATLYVFAPGSPGPPGFPRIVVQPRLLVSESDQRVELNCLAEGAQPMRHEWTRSNIRLDLSLPRYQLTRNGSLIIKKVVQEDDGSYQCAVTNSVGTVLSETAHLYVRRSAVNTLDWLLRYNVRDIGPHFSVKPASQEVPSGSSTNLTCIAVGSPMPTINWFDSKGTDLSPEKQPVGRFVLMLTDVTTDDNYTCIAENKMGRISWTVTVRVQKMPEPPSDLQIIKHTPTAVEVEFKKSVTPGVLTYTISYREEASRTIAGRNWIQIENVPGLGPGDRVRTRISSLRPHTKYQLKVDSVTTNSSSKDNSSNPIIEFMTLETFPGKAPKDIQVVAVSRADVNIAWKEPDDPNGIITQYRIYYTTRRISDIDSNTKISVPGTQRMHTIKNLEYNTTYYFRMTASNMAGEGPVSDVYPVITVVGNAALQATRSEHFAFLHFCATEPVLHPIACV